MKRFIHFHPGVLRAVGLGVGLFPGGASKLLTPQAQAQQKATPKQNDIGAAQEVVQTAIRHFNEHLTQCLRLDATIPSWESKEYSQQLFGRRKTLRKSAIEKHSGSIGHLASVMQESRSVPDKTYETKNNKHQSK
jgi:hypothetical protein